MKKFLLGVIIGGLMVAVSAVAQDTTTCPPCPPCPQVTPEAQQAVDAAKEAIQQIKAKPPMQDVSE